MDPDASKIMFPLLDLALHGDYRVRNIYCRYDEQLNAVVATAFRRIRPGDEIFTNYINYDTADNWILLETWGFTTERASQGKKTVRIHIGASEARAVQVPHLGREVLENSTFNNWNFSLCETATACMAEPFLSFLLLLLVDFAFVPS